MLLVLLHRIASKPRIKHSAMKDSVQRSYRAGISFIRDASKLGWRDNRRVPHVDELFFPPSNRRTRTKTLGMHNPETSLVIHHDRMQILGNPVKARNSKDGVSIWVPYDFSLGEALQISCVNSSVNKD